MISALASAPGRLMSSIQLGPRHERLIDRFELAVATRRMLRCWRVSVSRLGERGVRRAMNVDRVRFKAHPCRSGARVPDLVQQHDADPAGGISE